MNEEIIELIRLGDEYTKKFGYDPETLIVKGDSREVIREKLKKQMEKSKALAEHLRPLFNEISPKQALNRAKRSKPVREVKIIDILENDNDK